VALPFLRDEHGTRAAPYFHAGSLAQRCVMFDRAGRKTPTGACRRYDAKVERGPSARGPCLRCQMPSAPAPLQRVALDHRPSSSAIDIGKTAARSSPSACRSRRTYRRARDARQLGGHRSLDSGGKERTRYSRSARRRASGIRRQNSGHFAASAGLMRWIASVDRAMSPTTRGSHGRGGAVIQDRVARYARPESAGGGRESPHRDPTISADDPAPDAAPRPGHALRHRAR